MSFVGPAGNNGLQLVVSPGLSTVIKDHVRIIRVHENGRQLVILFGMIFGVFPCIPKNVMDMSHIPLQCDPLLHFRLRHRVVSAPVHRLGNDLQAFLLQNMRTHFGLAPLAASALDRIPHPGIPSPDAAVRLTVVRLLDETPLIRVIEDILLCGGLCKIKYTATAVQIDPQTDFAVINIILAGFQLGGLLLLSLRRQILRGLSRLIRFGQERRHRQKTCEYRPQKTSLCHNMRIHV